MTETMTTHQAEQGARSGGIDGRRIGDRQRGPATGRTCTLCKGFIDRECA